MIEIVIVLLTLSAIGICIFMKCMLDLNKRISELEKKIDNLQYQADDILCDINIVNENVLNPSVLSNSLNNGKNEQKPTNKIEPKFKVGDWVVDNCGYVWKIEGILNQFYLLEGMEVDESRPTIDWVDNTFHLWTIQDAKDGDVLAAHECYVVFKEIDGLNIKCYCTYHYLGLNPSFYIDTLQNKDAFLPATKEQRDVMMKAINDIGYEWYNTNGIPKRKN